MREAALPTEQQEAQEEARLPASDADARRAGGAQGASNPGSSPAVGLIYRVRGRGLFRELGRAPVKRQKCVSVRVCESRRAGPPQVAYSVGRRVGNAVVRNQVRRRLRSAVRVHRDRLRDGHAYLVAAGAGADVAPWSELRASVGHALTRTSEMR